VVNEVDYNNVGMDTQEFIELYNASPYPIVLTGVSVVRGNIEPYVSVDLSGSSPLAAGGYLVLANAGVSVASGATVIQIPDNSIRNSGPAIIRVIDSNSTIIDSLTYENGNVPVDPGIGSLSRLPNGFDTDDDSADWQLTSTPTPGSANIP
jgi:hypothetical protein